VATEFAADRTDRSGDGGAATFGAAVAVVEADVVEFM